MRLGIAQVVFSERIKLPAAIFIKVIKLAQVCCRGSTGMLTNINTLRASIPLNRFACGAQLNIINIDSDAC